jgi:hypothetical protein
MDKYLVLFPIPEPFNGQICLLMEKVASITGTQPPFWQLTPHMTFHRPLAGIDEDVLKNLVASAVLQMRRTRITLSGLFPFGKQYIVLPAQATRSVASLWVEINNLLSRLPEYEHGPYDDDNTLHVTVASKTSAVFDRAWPAIQGIRVESMTIPLQTICVCKKPIEGGKWENVASFSIPR